MFDDLLRWLDPNREVAGQKYEKIRATLTRIFIAKGFADAEDLTDIVLNRVNQKLPPVGEDYRKKIAFCHGVARNVMHEAWRRKEIATDHLPERPTTIRPTTDRYDCLLECLKLLTSDKRELILDYYLYEGAEKIEHHQQMASELDISAGALRLRAHHTRRDLERCVVQCVKKLAQNKRRLKNHSYPATRQATSKREP